MKQPSVSNVLAALVPTEKVPALAGAVLVECRSLKPGDLPRWLASEAQRLGKTLDRVAGELLASRAGEQPHGPGGPSGEAGGPRRGPADDHG